MFNPNDDMKNILLTLPALLLLAGACDKQAIRDGVSTLNVHWAEVPTKGAATDAEKKLNTLWFFVFDANGMLEIAHECTSAELTARQAGLTVKTGGKSVYAVANLTGAPLTAAKACVKAADLEAVTIDLADNSTTSFVMVARGTVTVSASSGGACSLSLERPVAKVSLGTVTNALPSPYGAVKVRQAFLCNVVGNQNLGGTASPSIWYNQNGTDAANGRKEATIGQGGHNAQVPSLTWKSYGTGQSVGLNGKYDFSSGAVFYAMPNATTAVPSNSPYTQNFTPTCTVLMLVVEIKSKLYYYPVALSKQLKKNTDNLVNIRLVGLGNTLDEGPFNKIGRAELAVDVRVLDWSAGSTYTETI